MELRSQPMLSALEHGKGRKIAGACCPWCSNGVVRRLGADAIDAEKTLALESVQLEHSEPPCREFAGAARSNLSRDETIFPVLDLSRTPPALRRLTLALLKVG